MTDSIIQIIGAVVFACAIIHTFSVHYFLRQAHRFPEGSVGANLFHVLGEVEIAFGLWAGVLLVIMALVAGKDAAIGYLDQRDFTEPMFVFVIMTIAATQPVIRFALETITKIGRVVPLPAPVAFYVACLTIGSLLGSLITEPAAMTVTALVLKERYLDRDVRPAFKYATLGLLFVNVSIGGVLTHFAAPPVVMVASTWNWGISHMWAHFGWKAVVAIVVNTVAVAALFYPTIRAQDPAPSIDTGGGAVSPWWLVGVYIGFLVFVVLTAHHAVVFMGFFLLFLGVTAITEKYQDALRLRQSLLVGFFLAGLVVLGGMQAWWLGPLIQKLDTGGLFAAATALTAFTDNAAITYLGSLIPGVSEGFKYALVAGAVAGGGMTVIANAPNPAGFAILQPSFGEDGISPLWLAAAAFLPTMVAMACFWWLPTL